MRLSESDFLIGERGFPAILQTPLHHRNGLNAGGYGNPELAFASLGCDDDLEAANKSPCHADFLALNHCG